MKQTVAGWGVQFIIYWVYTQSLKLIFWHFIKGLGLCLFRGGPVKKTPCSIDLWNVNTHPGGKVLLVCPNFIGGSPNLGNAQI